MVASGMAPLNPTVASDATFEPIAIRFPVAHVTGYMSGQAETCDGLAIDVSQLRLRDESKGIRA
jgi:hypothetical protein